MSYWKALVEFTCSGCGTKHQEAVELEVKLEHDSDSGTVYGAEVFPKTLPEEWTYGDYTIGAFCAICTAERLARFARMHKEPQ